MAVVKRVLVTGRVQGVGYRMSMYYAALRLNIKGWVRNRRDGAVEAVAQGDDADVEAFIQWAHKGPELARVDTVDVSESTGDFAIFEIRDTI